MAPTRSRKSYTYAKKLEVVQYAEEHGNMAAERMFGCSEANVRSWRKDKVKIQSKPKFKKVDWGKIAVFPELEEKLVQWTRDRQAEGVQVRRASIQLQALDILRMSTTGKLTKYHPIFNRLAWFNRFLKRHRLSLSEPVKDPKISTRPAQKEKERPAQKEKELSTQKKAQAEKEKETVDEVSSLCKNIAEMSTGPKETKKEKSVVNKAVASSVKTGSVKSVCLAQKSSGNDKSKTVPTGQMKCSKITSYFKVTAREEKTSEIKFDIHKKIKEEPIF